MKQKLKFLLAYCRGISDSLETTILFDRHYIEDWDEKFQTAEGKYVKFTKTFQDILIEICENYSSEIIRWLDWDIDEYWNLIIKIYPNEIVSETNPNIKGKIVFTAFHKQESLTEFEYTFNYDKVDNNDVKNSIDFLYSEFPDTAKFQYEGYGRYSDGEIYNFYVDGHSKKITSDIDNSLWTIANQLLKKKLGTWWNDGPGADFSVTIWGDDIFIDGFWKEQDFQDSGVNLKVTLDNIEEFED